MRVFVCTPVPREMLCASNRTNTLTGRYPSTTKPSDNLRVRTKAPRGDDGVCGLEIEVQNRSQHPIDTHRQRFTSRQFSGNFRGCFGIRVDQPGQIQSALEQAIASGKPAVIDVVSDIDGIAPPSWRP